MKRTLLIGLLAAASHSLFLHPDAPAQASTSSVGATESDCRRNIDEWVEAVKPQGFDMRLTRYRAGSPDAASAAKPSKAERVEEFSVAGTLLYRPENVTELAIQPLKISQSLLKNMEGSESSERRDSTSEKNKEGGSTDGDPPDTQQLHLLVHDGTVGVFDKRGVLRQLPITDFGLGYVFRKNSGMTVLGTGSEKSWDAIGRGPLGRLKFSAAQQVICISRLRRVVADSLNEKKGATSNSSFDAGARTISLELTPARSRELDFLSLATVNKEPASSVSHDSSVAFTFSRDAKVESVEVTLRYVLTDDGEITYVFRLTSNGNVAATELSPETRTILDLPSKR